jgi:SAM-dependent methyltransferase
VPGAQGLEACAAVSTWDDQYKAGQGRFWPAEELVRFLGRTYGPVTQRKGSGLTAVEIGSGVGGNVWALAEWGFFTYGLELSAEAIRLGIEHARQHGFENLKEYRQYKAPAPIHLPAKCANLVVDVQTLQHLSKDEHKAMYQEAYRILAHGGKLFSIHWVGQESSAKAIFPSHPELCIWGDVPEICHLIEANGFSIPYREVVAKTYGVWLARWLVIEAVKP